MLRVMIIGCGAIAPKHIEGYLSKNEDCKITVLASVDLEKAVQLNEEFKLDALCIADFKEGLDKCDVVSVCTPPKTHKDIAIMALEAGKHVICEKPLASSIEDCDAMIAAAEKNGRILSSIAQNRFTAENWNALGMVRNKELGKLLHTDVHSYWFRTEKYYKMDWRGKWEVEGGGVTINNAIHHVDLLLWASGMPSSVYAVFQNLNHKNSNEEDISVCIFKYPDGSLATMTNSMLHHGEEKMFNFQSEKGGFVLPGFRAQCSTSCEEGFGRPDPEGQKAIEDLYASKVFDKPEKFCGQIGNFIDAIVRGDELLVTAIDGRNALEVVVAIYKSAITGEVVSLPLDRSDKYCTHEGRIEDAPRFNS